MTWPLKGRSEEMQLIAAGISNTDVPGIFLAGAAGVGKSRVAREALSAAESLGAEIRWAVATTAARALPLGTFASFLGSASGDTLQLVRHGRSDWPSHAAAQSHPRLLKPSNQCC